MFEPGRDSGDHVQRYLVLELEDIGRIAVVTFGPDMGTGFTIDQLSGDAHATARLADAAFQYVAHTEFTSDLLDVDGFALVSEARIAGDDEQRLEARQCGDDVLNESVDKVLLLRVATHVLKRQHRNRRLVR